MAAGVTSVAGNTGKFRKRTNLAVTTATNNAQRSKGNTTTAATTSNKFRQIDQSISYNNGKFRAE